MKAYQNSVVLYVVFYFLAILLVGCGSNHNASKPFVYVANLQSQTISAYSSYANTGTLKPISGSPFPLGNQGSFASYAAGSLALDPQNQFLFALLSDKIAVFKIDATTGALAPIQGSPFSFTGTARTLAIDPMGRFVYVSTHYGGISGWSINRADNTLSDLAGTPFGSASRTENIDIDLQGKFLYGSAYTAGLQVYAIDGLSGALTPVGVPSTSPEYFPVKMTFHSSGKFAYLDAQNTSMSPVLLLVTVDAQTGAVSGLAGPDLGIYSGSSYISPDGKWLFLDAKWEYSIDASSGSLTPIATLPFGVPYALAFRADSTFVYVATNGVGGSIAVYSLDSKSGTTKLVLGSTIPTAGDTLGLVVTQ